MSKYYLLRERLLWSLTVRPELVEGRIYETKPLYFTLRLGSG